MKKIRIKKDILVTWKILTDGEPLDLEGRNLSVEITTPKCKAFTDFVIVKNLIGFTFYGVDQHHLGKYSLTLWENYGHKGQSVLDKANAFELVSSTEFENDEESDTLQLVTLELSNDVTDQGDIVLNHYYTKEQLDEILSHVVEPYDDTEIRQLIASLASQMLDKVNTTTFDNKVAEIEGEVAKKANESELSNYSLTSHTHQQYLTEETEPQYNADKPNIALKSDIPSLDGYATEQWVGEQGYLTEHQQLKTINNQSIIGDGNIEIKSSDPYDDTEIRQEIADTKAIAESKTTMAEVEAKGYITAYTETDPIYIADKPNIALKSEIPTVPTNVSAFENDANYLTEHQQLKTINNESIVGDGNIQIDGAIYTAGLGISISDDNVISTPLKEQVDVLEEKVDELQLYKFPNVTIFGQPTINNGQISNFSNVNYLQFPFLVDFQNKAFTIEFSFTTSDDLSGQQNILDSNHGLAFATRNGLVLTASEDGETWTSGELIDSTPLTPRTTYYIKIQWSRSELFGSWSLDKEQWHTIGVANMANTPYPKTIYIGRSYIDGGNYFKGSINLNDAKLIIADKVVWSGMDDVGLATRAAVDLSNIDSIGVDRIKTITLEQAYSKEEIDNKGYLTQETEPQYNADKDNLALKSDVYTKTEIDNKIGNIETLLSKI